MQKRVKRVEVMYKWKQTARLLDWDAATLLSSGCPVERILSSAKRILQWPRGPMATLRENKLTDLLQTVCDESAE